MVGKKPSGQAVRHKQKRLRLQGKHPQGACDQHLYEQIQGGGVHGGLGSGEVNCEREQRRDRSLL